MSSKRKQARPKAAMKSADGIEFGIGEIMSVVADWGFSDLDDVSFLLGYLHGLRKDQELETVERWKSAKESAAEWICKQLPWAKSAAGSLAKFKGAPEHWLEKQAAKHGEFHRLAPITRDSPALEPPDSREDPLASIAEKSDEDARQLLAAAGEKSSETLRSAERITGARCAVEKLMESSLCGSASDRLELFHIACDIVSFFSKSHWEFIKERSRFPVVLAADNKERARQLEAFKHLPIGSNIGFAQIKKGGRGPSLKPESPVALWQYSLFNLSGLQSLVRACGGDLDRICRDPDLPWKADRELLERIGDLGEFGTSDEINSDWVNAAVDLYDANPAKIPKWITRRAAPEDEESKQRGNPLADELRKGCEYCIRSQK